MVAQLAPYEAPAVHAYAITLCVWRERANLSKVDLAESLGYTPQLIGQIEAAKNLPSRKFSEDLDTFFQSGDLFVRLWILINGTRYLIALPPGISQFVELEGDASRIYAFDALLIPGLLQTEAYARAVIRSLSTSDDIEEAVKTHMARKEIFNRPTPPRAFFIIDEWVLYRTIGSPDIAKEQLAHLLELTEQPGTHIQVLSYDSEHHAALSGSFTILGFDSNPDVVYIEAAGQGNLIAGARSVAECVSRYDLLRGHAYSVTESRRAIRTAMESLEQL